MDQTQIKSDETILLTETVKINGIDNTFNLTLQGLKFFPISKETSATFLKWPEVICVKPAEKSSQAGLFTLYYIHRSPNNILDVKTLKLQGHSEQCLNVINEQIADSGRPKKLFVVINPIGGSGNGVQIYHNKVEPLFRLAGIETVAVVTERPNHATEIGETTDFTQYDGIVVVGGDGFYYEVLQGVTLQQQKKSGYNYDNPEGDLVRLNTPIGVIPAGSGNGAAIYFNLGVLKTGNITFGAKTAALNIIRGERNRASVLAIYCNNKLLCVCGYCIGYGMPGDIIKRSQELRWMKKFRYPYTLLGQLFKRKRLFQAELHYRLYSADSGDGAASNSGWICHEPRVQQYTSIFGIAYERVAKGVNIYYNPYGEHFPLAVCTLSSKWTALMCLADITMGKEIPNTPGKTLFLDKATDFKIKVIRENLSGDTSVSESNAIDIDLEKFLNVDGEPVHLENTEFIVRLQTSFVPVFGFKLTDVE